MLPADCTFGHFVECPIICKMSQVGSADNKYECLLVFIPSTVFSFVYVTPF